MAYNPEIHHRRSIRLKGYDYSLPGYYFITACCQNRQGLFGEVCDGVMQLNEAGRMINDWWQKVPEKYPDIRLDAYVVMPDHFHAIVVNVGADPCVCPFSSVSPLVRPFLPDESLIDRGNERGDLGEHVGSPLRDVLRWFKTMTTNGYIRGVKQLGWTRFDGKLWQRNYYERIIRDEREYVNVVNYIRNNPANFAGK